MDADPHTEAARKYLCNVEDTLKTLLSREDTDNNVQITIEDTGPKVSFRYDQLIQINADQCRSDNCPRDRSLRRLQTL